MIATVLAAWPMIKWALQALGMMGPEEKEKERDYKLRLMEAAEKKEAALIEAFARFHASRLNFERVYTMVVGSLLFYDIAFGPGRSIQRAQQLQEAGIPGLLVMSILLFPFYGPALVQGVATAFGAAVDLSMKRGQGEILDGKNGSVRSPQTDLGKNPPGPETEKQRLERLNRERNDAIIGRDRPNDR